MAKVTLRIDDVFDIPTRGGLVVVGSPVSGELIGVPELHDAATGRSIRVLGVDHPTPRTLRTGQVILVVDRKDTEFAAIGRTWESV